MDNLQLWMALLTLISGGGVAGFWYGYGKLNQKVDSNRDAQALGFEQVTTRLDRMNSRVDRHDEQIADTAIKVARMEGSHGASLGD